MGQVRSEALHLLRTDTYNICHRRRVRLQHHSSKTTVLTTLQAYWWSYQDSSDILGQSRSGCVLYAQSSIGHTNSNAYPAFEHWHFFWGLEQE